LAAGKAVVLCSDTEKFTGRRLGADEFWPIDAHLFLA
jgi:hypothetical protein